MDEKKGKIERILGLYTKLINGGIVKKAEEAFHYNVNERSIQRDIDDIRNYLEQEAENQGVINSVIYDRELNGYRLEQIYRYKLTNGEVLAICKILLDSRAFRKQEISEILSKLIAGCVPKENQELVADLVKNEEFHYIELQHKTDFIDTLWKLGEAVRSCSMIELEYKRTKDKQLVKRKVRPVAIMFSEYYFYLTAFIDDSEVQQHFDVLNDSFPTIYRVDRIKRMTVLDEKFHIPYSSRFEEGEFRKRIQFMQGGKLRKLKLQCKEQSLEAVLDRLPTAKILSENEGVYTISAEVFGDGVDMWIRSQGNNVNIV
jgi:predicted DNA-binding transcriptional regulator YafY